MNANARNFKIVVATWMAPMFFTPDRFTNAGSHRPMSTSRMEAHRAWPLLTNSSTYSTQPTAIAALPAHAVIQYDQALVKPSGFP